jgi:VCBS repeat-containing protein/probable HAF family extracellular repeat protein
LRIPNSTIDVPFALPAIQYPTDTTGINQNNQIIGNYQINVKNYGFLFANGIYTSIDDPFAAGNTFGTFVNGLNDLGQIVGYYSDSNFFGGNLHGFLYSGNSYITIDISSAYRTVPVGINDTGQIFGNYFIHTPGFFEPPHGFLYVNGTYTTIDDPLAIAGTSLVDMNDSGQIVGNYADNTGNHGFLSSNGAYTPIDDPFASGRLGGATFITAINSSGQIVGHYADAVGTHGFLYSNGTYTTIDDPFAIGSALGTTVTGINASGQMVGYYFDVAGTLHSFLYSDGLYKAIDDPFATSGTYAISITDTGQILGTYSIHGFLATPSTPLDQPPVVSNISANANEDTNNPLVKLLAAFTDADLSDSFTFTNDPTGTIGKVTNNNDGTFTYEPNGKFEFLGVGETATDKFTYAVTDNHGASSTATATVTIHGENDAPIAALDIVSVQKGTTFRADKAHGVLADDTDPDTHDIATLKVSAVNGSSNLIGHPIKGTYGTLTLASDGSYTYAMKNNAPVGAQDVFQYSISDVHGATSNSTLTLQIPYAPLVVSSATLTGSVNERSLVTGSGANDAISAQVIAYNVPDPNNRPTATRDLAHQTITWQDSTHDYTSQLTSAEIAALASAFSITQTDNANTGKVTWAYKITDSTLDFLGVGETVTITTPILIDDHHGNVIPENVVVTINGADDKPTVSGPITSTVKSGC